MYGKEKYDEIVIPSNLSEVIQDARKRAHKQKRNKRVWRGSSLAAACAAVVIAVNVPTVAMALSDVPIIGSVVKIFQIGSGGQSTDGAVATTKQESDSLNIQFKVDGNQLASAPAYTVERLEGPDRLVFTFNGVRELDVAKMEKDIRALHYVKDVYRNMILDDSAVRFVIELQDNVDYSVSEYKDPGYIQLKLFSAADRSQPRELFFVRSQDMEEGEALAMLAEQFHDEGSSMVKTRTGKFAVVMGGFDNEAQAKTWLQQMKQQKEEEAVSQLYVDHWMSNANPQ